MYSILECQWMNKQKSKHHLIEKRFICICVSTFIILSLHFSFHISENNKKLNPSQIIFTYDDEPEPFKRHERNRAIDQQPFKFPINAENSRRVRWPHERHSAHALDSSAAINPMSIIVFPRSQTKTKNDNELPVVEIAQPTTMSAAVKPNESTETTAQQNSVPVPFVLDAINSTVFLVNKTAIQNELMPMIYIDDEGIFQVKYIPKGETETVSISNADQQHQQQRNSTSINNTEEIAIISNDNQQILLDQHIHSETNVVNSTKATPTAPIIDLTQDHTINNVNPVQQQNEKYPENTSFRPRQQQQQKQQPNQLSGDKQSTLFNELPIFT